MKSVLFAAFDVVIGNGTGQHAFTAGRSYSLKSLESDARLTRAQIRHYFREFYTQAKPSRHEK